MSSQQTRCSPAMGAYTATTKRRWGQRTIRSKRRLPNELLYELAASWTAPNATAASGSSGNVVTACVVAQSQQLLLPMIGGPFGVYFRHFWRTKVTLRRMLEIISNRRVNGFKNFRVQFLKNRERQIKRTVWLNFKEYKDISLSKLCDELLRLFKPTNPDFAGHKYIIKLQRREGDFAHIKGDMELVVILGRGEDKEEPVTIYFDHHIIPDKTSTQPQNEIPASDVLIEMRYNGSSLRFKKRRYEKIGSVLTNWNRSKPNLPIPNNFTIARMVKSEQGEDVYIPLDKNRKFEMFAANESVILEVNNAP